MVRSSGLSVNVILSHIDAGSRIRFTIPSGSARSNRIVRQSPSKTRGQKSFDETVELFDSLSTAEIETGT